MNFLGAARGGATSRAGVFGDDMQPYLHAHSHANCQLTPSFRPHRPGLFTIKFITGDKGLFADGGGFQSWHSPAGPIPLM